MYLVVFNFEGDVSNTCQKKCWDRSKGPIADNMTESFRRSYCEAFTTL